jgi:hypothetical protein
MTNSDTIKASFLARKIRLLEEKRNNAEDIKELGLEMRKAELSKVEIDGINLAAKRNFESAEKREHRVSVEQVADELGPYADTPLGAAAMERVAAHA